MLEFLREYCESGVQLIVGEAFGISKEARKVADDYPNIAFLMGDPFKPHGNNFSVFDNYIHEPCYLMGIIAGNMTKAKKNWYGRWLRNW
jgi:basic membrane lipoprotein Med (substrate-binding protein (PBP1-ABC) superfamily)